MNKTMNDCNGNTFITDDTIGAEHDSVYLTLINAVNCEVLLDEAKKEKKSIVNLSPWDVKNRPLDTADVVVITYGYGGKECYVRDIPENENLCSLIHSLEEYPCLDDERLSKKEREYVSELVSSHDFITYIENQLSPSQLDFLSDCESNYCQYRELASCPIYDEKLFDPDEFVTRTMLVAMLGKDIDTDRLTVDDFETMTMSDENKNSLLRNFEALQNWQKQEQTNCSNPV